MHNVHMAFLRRDTALCDESQREDPRAVRFEWIRRSPALSSLPQCSARIPSEQIRRRDTDGCWQTGRRTLTDEQRTAAVNEEAENGKEAEEE